MSVKEARTKKRTYNSIFFFLKSKKYKQRVKRVEMGRMGRKVFLRGCGVMCVHVILIVVMVLKVYMYLGKNLSNGVL